MGQSKNEPGREREVHERKINDVQQQGENNRKIGEKQGCPERGRWRGEIKEKG